MMDVMDDIDATIMNFDSFDKMSTDEKCYILDANRDLIAIGLGDSILISNGLKYIIAFNADNEPIGCIAMDDEDGRIWIYLLHVSADYRKWGLAGKLLNAVREQYPKMNIEFITKLDNTAMQGAAEKYGYKKKCVWYISHYKGQNDG